MLSRSINSGSSGSGEVATDVQYDITVDRDFQEGKRTDSRNVRDVSLGIGWRVKELGRDGLRMDVDAGSKGAVLAGVINAFRFVEMLSSMLARDSRRKSRNTRVLKQNCGVSSAGVEVGLGMISSSEREFGLETGFGGRG